MPVDSLLAFLDASPSPYHAVATAAARLDAHGWSAVDVATTWPTSGRHYLAVGGALVAWNRPVGAGPASPFRVVGAHTDSPNLRVKPRADTGSAGWRQLAVEIYGGALLNSWLDRDLGLSGRVVLNDGTVHLLHVDEAIARIPQLAIHLDRDVNDKGLVLDKQLHVTPVWGLGPTTDGEFVDWIAHRLEVRAADVRTWDVMFHDITPATLLGRERAFIASGRLDNLCSSWCAIEALVTHAADPGAPDITTSDITTSDITTSDITTIAVLFDHEEIGSESTTGAAGPLLERVVYRLIGDSAEHRHQSLSNSMCVSADMAHAVHPNYPERHEPMHRPLPNGGPVIKVNANQRYATDAITHAAFRRACSTAGVPSQVFVSRNSMPCGSTIGPITATRLGIPTVDVGCAQLSMHSARELCGAEDPDMMAAALTAFYQG
jgi:aspartyl aminopeptidase